MSKIRLEDATISFEEKWLSVDDLSKKIQDKISAGDMKFADIAEALEELQAVIEQSQTIDVTLVITKAEYKSFTSIGGKNDNDCVRKAIMYYIGNSSETAPTQDASEPPEEELLLEENPDEQLEKQEKDDDKKNPRFVDHFMG
jgi:hypothetical protein